tara:strand:+ start:5728 stop:5874 length:147 start_codon:yes stop_codon:yes gene_type:complete
MNPNLNWLRYLAPLAGIVFCPVTILFLWAMWSGPIEGVTEEPKIEFNN